MKIKIFRITHSKIGFNAILIGEALVRSEDPMKLIMQMKGL